jgi:hypothetical protein
MRGCRCNISLIVGLVSLLSVKAFSQQTNIGTTLSESNSEKVLFKPRLNYLAGSSFIVIPQIGTVSEFTLSPMLSIPLSQKLYVEGGIMASYFYSAPWKSDDTGLYSGSFTGLSVYGSATYHFTPQFSLFGSAVKQLAGTSPFYTIPKSNYIIGTAYNFGNFSIGVSFQMSNWDNLYTPFPVNGSNGFYSPFNQGWISH